MRVCICCCVALLMIGSQPQFLLRAQASGQQKAGEPNAPPPSPLSGEDKANELSDQVGKLMVKCVNLLTAQDPLSLDYCKQQRDLADQYPPRERMVDKMLAHDEYGIALAAFDHKKEALEEFDQEVALVPKAVKPGSPEWSTAYWHRAMIYTQMGEMDKADRDYRAAEANFRKASFNSGRTLGGEEAARYSAPACRPVAEGRQDRSGAPVAGRGGEVGRMTEEASPTEKPRMKNIPRDVEPYFIAFLLKGERWNDTQGADVADLVPRQLAFIREQVQAGRYLLAGPITDDGPLVGISIIAAGTAAEALAIATADPGVQAGRLRVEVHPAFLPSLKELKINYS